MTYAFSMTYEYEPYVIEYMNYPNDDDLNFSYCRNVVGYMKTFCSMEKSTDNIVFQECCRNYFSLTPSQVGKHGNMWGQDDFLHWFQCVFNIRNFIITMSSFEIDGKTKITTSSNFVHSFQFQNSKEFQSEENYENDGIFDLYDKKKLIPYGIMIVLMEDQHYERVLIPYDQKSPLIPVGSPSVTHILPYMKISEKVWISISVDNVKQHNNAVLDKNELDCNKELNYWYDYHVAYKKMKKMSFQVMPPLIEKNQDYQKYSVPKCAIRYHGFYIAMLCYLTAIRNDNEHSKFVSYNEVYSIGMSDNEDDTESLLQMLEDDNKKLYSNDSLTSDGDPFSKEKLFSHYENCYVKIKDKMYCDYLKANKGDGNSNKTSYSSQERRKEFIDTGDLKQMIELLESEGMVPHHLMPKKKKSQIEEKTKKLNDKQSSNRKLNYDKKVDLKSKKKEK